MKNPSSALGAGLGWGLVAALTLGLFFSQFPALYDTDSYYHLAIARAYAKQGIITELPWARFSLFHEQFGDKELGFHMVLALAAGADDPEQGARWALAAFNALIIGIVAWIGRYTLGRWGLLVPLLIYCGSSHFAARIIRLRPELFALSLLLIATWLAGRRRYRWLGFVSCIFTLSYTAFHALLGLAAAWFVVESVSRRQQQWGLILYPVLGIGLGLMIHPDFPHNLLIWKVQSIDFFIHKDALDVGPEIRSANAVELLRSNALWALALLAMFRARVRTARPSDRSMANVFAIAALAFSILFCLSGRFAIYAIPFATAAFGFELKRRGFEIGSRIPIFRRASIPTVVVLTALAGGSLMLTAPTAADLVGARGELSRQVDWRQFAASIPTGAKVAAEWGSTHIYMYWAPQAQYLNVLDPIFMALPFPHAFEQSRSIFTGREPDIATALTRELDSRFIALSAFHPHPRLIDRLRNDPRIVERYRGYTLLFEVRDEFDDSFVDDWTPLPTGTRLPVVDPAILASEGSSYPSRAFVPLHEGSGRCSAWAHHSLDSGNSTFELAPAGATTLWVDDRLVVPTSGDLGAFLGEGIVFSVDLPSGEHTFTVLTCRPRTTIARGGFYLRKLPSETTSAKKPEPEH